MQTLAVTGRTCLSISGLRVAGLVSSMLLYKLHRSISSRSYPSMPGGELVGCCDLPTTMLQIYAERCWSGACDFDLIIIIYERSRRATS